MVELAENGAGAFSDDGKPITNLTVLRRALDYVKLTNAFIISHPEDADLSLHGVMNESASSTRLGLIGAPTAAEAAAIAREIEVVRYTKSRLHFAHVSAAASVSLIRRAKEDGLNVSADVTPHHLALTDNEIECYHGSYKMNPPLRTGEDQESLLEGLRDGTIDAIATDHAPHSNSTKNKTFDSCAFGVIGLETAFALMYDKLVKTNLFSLDHLIQLFSLRPAQILGRVAPKISKGATANLTVVDTRRSWRYDADQGFSKSSNSPFDGHTFTSKVILTIAQGKVSFEDLSK